MQRSFVTLIIPVVLLSLVLINILITPPLIPHRLPACWQYTPDLSGFAPVSGRHVEAWFDVGLAILRHDLAMAVLAVKRPDCARVAGKSTLNRLELSSSNPTRYHEISHQPSAIEARRMPPAQFVLDLDVIDDPLYGDQEGCFFHAYYDCYCCFALYTTVRSALAGGSA